jgi:structural maintenance of chromosome 4
MEQDHEQSPPPPPSPPQEDHNRQEEEIDTEDMLGQEHTGQHHHHTTESSPHAQDTPDVDIDPAEQPDLEESEQKNNESSTTAPSSSQQSTSSGMLAPPTNTLANSSSRQSSPNASAFAKRNSIALSESNSATAATKEPTLELKPRLVIEKMVLVNFKSYAGRQEIGPFHKSFTSVVGPNGSGKSNVIDALLFVFGYRANKMRQGKLSELIHNSKGAEDLDSCTVEIHFCEILDLVS